MLLQEDKYTECDCLKKERGFFELMEFLSKYDPGLKEHLLRTKMSNKITVSYLLPQIQNELSIVHGENVKNKIVDQVKRVKHFAMTFDSTQDLTKQSRASLWFN